MGKVLPLSKILETRENKQILSDSLVEPAEIVLKNNIFEFDKKTLKHIWGTAIGTKFLPSHAILFMADLEDKMLKISEKKNNNLVEVHRFHLGA